MPVLNLPFVQGETYAAAHQGSAALAEFQKILNHRSVVQTSRSAHWRTWVWPARTAFLATPPRRRVHTRISSPSGKTPTPTFPSWSEPRPSTRSCN